MATKPIAKPQNGRPAPKQKPSIQRASHDAAAPEAFIEMMMSGWKAPAARADRRVPAVPGLDRIQARRTALSKQHPGETIIVPSGVEKVRSNDTNHPFRPGSDFFYLTGNFEPGAVFALVPRKKGKGHDAVLFVEPEVDRSTPGFFLDRARGALWVGPKLGLEGSRARFGVKEARSIDTLENFLKAQERPRTRLLRGLDPRCDAALKPAKQDAELATELAERRMIKDAGELASLKKAILSTKRALESAIWALRDAKSERELEASFDATARVEGNGVGFATIVAAGRHACTLHWTQNDGPLRRGDLVLIDAGVEGKDLYSGDISRTFPASGRFTEEQRRIYDLVTRAQDAAIRAVEPGADFTAPHEAAVRVLTEGLIELGVIKMPLEEALDPERQPYRRYTLHNVSHLLGLDVHDSAAARPENYRRGTLKPGMVLTIEPGLYFQPEDLTVPPRYRGIGIRVEEDVAVTESGRQVLSASIPRKSAAVEKWIADIWDEDDEDFDEEE